MIIGSGPIGSSAIADGGMLFGDKELDGIKQPSPAKTDCLIYKKFIIESVDLQSQDAVGLPPLENHDLVSDSAHTKGRFTKVIKSVDASLESEESTVGTDIVSVIRNIKGLYNVEDSKTIGSMYKILSIKESLKSRMASCDSSPRAPPLHADHSTIGDVIYRTVKSTDANLFAENYVYSPESKRMGYLIGTVILNLEFEIENHEDILLYDSIVTKSVVGGIRQWEASDETEYYDHLSCDAIRTVKGGGSLISDQTFISNHLSSHMMVDSESTMTGFCFKKFWDTESDLKATPHDEDDTLGDMYLWSFVTGVTSYDDQDPNHNDDEYLSKTVGNMVRTSYVIGEIQSESSIIENYVTHSIFESEYSTTQGLFSRVSVIIDGVVVPEYEDVLSYDSFVIRNLFGNIKHDHDDPDQLAHFNDSLLTRVSNVLGEIKSEESLLLSDVSPSKLIADNSITQGLFSRVSKISDELESDNGESDGLFSHGYVIEDDNLEAQETEHFTQYIKSDIFYSYLSRVSNLFGEIISQEAVIISYPDESEKEGNEASTTGLVFFKREANGDLESDIGSTEGQFGKDVFADFKMKASDAVGYPSLLSRTSNAFGDIESNQSSLLSHVTFSRLTSDDSETIGLFSKGLNISDELESNLGSSKGLFSHGYKIDDELEIEETDNLTQEIGGELHPSLLAKHSNILGDILSEDSVVISYPSHNLLNQQDANTEGLIHFIWTISPDIEIEDECVTDGLMAKGHNLTFDIVSQDNDYLKQTISGNSHPSLLIKQINVLADVKSEIAVIDSYPDESDKEGNEATTTGLLFYKWEGFGEIESDQGFTEGLGESFIACYGEIEVLESDVLKQLINEELYHSSLIRQSNLIGNIESEMAALVSYPDESEKDVQEAIVNGFGIRCANINGEITVYNTNLQGIIGDGTKIVNIVGDIVSVDASIDCIPKESELISTISTTNESWMSHGFNIDNHLNACAPTDVYTNVDAESITQDTPEYPWTIIQTGYHIRAYSYDSLPEYTDSQISFFLPGNYSLHFNWDVQSPIHNLEYFSVLVNDELVFYSNSVKENPGFEIYRYDNFSNDPVKISLKYSRFEDTSIDQVVISNLSLIYNSHLCGITNGLLYKIHEAYGSLTQKISHIVDGLADQKFNVHGDAFSDNASFESYPQHSELSASAATTDALIYKFINLTGIRHPFSLNLYDGINLDTENPWIVEQFNYNIVGTSTKSDVLTSELLFSIPPSIQQPLLLQTYIDVQNLKNQNDYFTLTFDGIEVFNSEIDYVGSKELYMMVPVGVSSVIATHHRSDPENESIASLRDFVISLDYTVRATINGSLYYTYEVIADLTSQPASVSTSVEDVEGGVDEATMNGLIYHIHTIESNVESDELLPGSIPGFIYKKNVWFGHGDLKQTFEKYQQYISPKFVFDDQICQSENELVDWEFDNFGNHTKGISSLHDSSTYSQFYYVISSYNGPINIIFDLTGTLEESSVSIFVNNNKVETIDTNNNNYVFNYDLNQDPLISVPYNMLSVVHCLTDNTIDSWSSSSVQLSKNQRYAIISGEYGSSPTVKIYDIFESRFIENNLTDILNGKTFVTQLKSSPTGQFLMAWVNETGTPLEINEYYVNEDVYIFDTITWELVNVIENRPRSALIDFSDNEEYFYVNEYHYSDINPYWIFVIQIYTTSNWEVSSYKFTNSSRQDNMSQISVSRDDKLLAVHGWQYIPGPNTEIYSSIIFYNIENGRIGTYAGRIDSPYTTKQTSESFFIKDSNHYVLTHQRTSVNQPILTVFDVDTSDIISEVYVSSLSESTTFKSRNERYIIIVQDDNCTIIDVQNSYTVYHDFIVTDGSILIKSLSIFDNNLIISHSGYGGISIIEDFDITQNYRVPDQQYIPGNFSNVQVTISNVNKNDVYNVTRRELDGYHITHYPASITGSIRSNNWEVNLVSDAGSYWHSRYIRPACIFQDTPEYPWTLTLHDQGVIGHSYSGLPRNQYSQISFVVPTDSHVMFEWDVRSPYSNFEYFVVLVDGQQVFYSNLFINDPGYSSFRYVIPASDDNETAVVSIKYQRYDNTNIDQAYIKDIVVMSEFPHRHITSFMSHGFNIDNNLMSENVSQTLVLPGQGVVNKRIIGDISSESSTLTSGSIYSQMASESANVDSTLSVKYTITGISIPYTKTLYDATQKTPDAPWLFEENHNGIIASSYAGHASKSEIEIRINRVYDWHKLKLQWDSQHNINNVDRFVIRINHRVEFDSSLDVNNFGNVEIDFYNYSTTRIVFAHYRSDPTNPSITSIRAVRSVANNQPRANINSLGILERKIHDSLQSNDSDIHCDMVLVSKIFGMMISENSWLISEPSDNNLISSQVSSTIGSLKRIVVGHGDLNNCGIYQIHEFILPKQVTFDTKSLWYQTDKNWWNLDFVDKKVNYASALGLDSNTCSQITVPGRTGWDIYFWWKVSSPMLDLDYFSVYLTPKNSNWSRFPEKREWNYISYPDIFLTQPYNWYFENNKTENVFSDIGSKNGYYLGSNFSFYIENDFELSYKFIDTRTHVYQGLPILTFSINIDGEIVHSSSTANRSVNYDQQYYFKYDNHSNSSKNVSINFYRENYNGEIEITDLRRLKVEIGPCESGPSYYNYTKFYTNSYLKNTSIWRKEVNTYLGNRTIYVNLTKDNYPDNGNYPFETFSGSSSVNLPARSKLNFQSRFFEYPKSYIRSCQFNINVSGYGRLSPFMTVTGVDYYEYWNDTDDPCVVSFNVRCVLDGANNFAYEVMFAANPSSIMLAKLELYHIRYLTYSNSIQDRHYTFRAPTNGNQDVTLRYSRHDLSSGLNQAIIRDFSYVQPRFICSSFDSYVTPSELIAGSATMIGNQEPRIIYLDGIREPFVLRLQDANHDFFPCYWSISNVGNKYVAISTPASCSESILWFEYPTVFGEEELIISLRWDMRNPLLHDKFMIRLGDEILFDSSHVREDGTNVIDEYVEIISNSHGSSGGNLTLKLPHQEYNDGPLMFVHYRYNLTSNSRTSISDFSIISGSAPRTLMTGSGTVHRYISGDIHAGKPRLHMHHLYNGIVEGFGIMNAEDAYMIALMYKDTVHEYLFYLLDRLLGYDYLGRYLTQESIDYLKEIIPGSNVNHTFLIASIYNIVGDPMYNRDIVDGILYHITHVLGIIKYCKVYVEADILSSYASIEPVVVLNNILGSNSNELESGDSKISAVPILNGLVFGYGRIQPDHAEMDGSFGHIYLIDDGIESGDSTLLPEALVNYLVEIDGNLSSGYYSCIPFDKAFQVKYRFLTQDSPECEWYYDSVEDAFVSCNSLDFNSETSVSFDITEPMLVQFDWKLLSPFYDLDYFKVLVNGTQVFGATSMYSGRQYARFSHYVSKPNSQITLKYEKYTVSDIDQVCIRNIRLSRCYDIQAIITGFLFKIFETRSADLISGPGVIEGFGHLTHEIDNDLTVTEPAIFENRPVTVSELHADNAYLDCKIQRLVMLSGIYVYHELSEFDFIHPNSCQWLVYEHNDMTYIKSSQDPYCLTSMIRHEVSDPVNNYMSFQIDSFLSDGDDIIEIYADFVKVFDMDSIVGYRDHYTIYIGTASVVRFVHSRTTVPSLGQTSIKNIKIHPVDRFATINADTKIINSMVFADIISGNAYITNENEHNELVSDGAMITGVLANARYIEGIHPCNYVKGLPLEFKYKITSVNWHFTEIDRYNIIIDDILFVEDFEPDELPEWHDNSTRDRWNVYFHETNIRVDLVNYNRSKYAGFFLELDNNKSYDREIRIDFKYSKKHIPGSAISNGLSVSPYVSLIDNRVKLFYEPTTIRDKYVFRNESLGNEADSPAVIPSDSNAYAAFYYFDESDDIGSTDPYYSIYDISITETKYHNTWFPGFDEIISTPESRRLLTPMHVSFVPSRIQSLWLQVLPITFKFHFGFDLSIYLADPDDYLVVRTVHFTPTVLFDTRNSDYDHLWSNNNVYRYIEFETELPITTTYIEITMSTVKYSQTRVRIKNPMIIPAICDSSTVAIIDCELVVNTNVGGNGRLISDHAHIECDADVIHNLTGIRDSNTAHTNGELYILHVLTGIGDSEDADIDGDLIYIPPVHQINGIKPAQDADIDAELIHTPFKWIIGDIKAEEAHVDADVDIHRFIIGWGDLGPSVIYGKQEEYVLDLSDYYTYESPMDWNITEYFDNTLGRHVTLACADPIVMQPDGSYQRRLMRVFVPGKRTRKVIVKYEYKLFSTPFGHITVDGYNGPVYSYIKATVKTVDGNVQNVKIFRSDNSNASYSDPNNEEYKLMTHEIDLTGDVFVEFEYFFNMLPSHHAYPCIRDMKVFESIRYYGAHVDAEFNMGYNIDADLYAGNGYIEMFINSGFNIDGEMISDNAVIESYPTGSELISEEANLFGQIEALIIGWGDLVNGGYETIGSHELIGSDYDIGSWNYSLRPDGIYMTPGCMPPVFPPPPPQPGCGSSFGGTGSVAESMLLGLDSHVTHVDIDFTTHRNPDRFLIFNGMYGNLTSTMIENGDYPSGDLLFDSGWRSSCADNSCFQALVDDINSINNINMTLSQFLSFFPGVSTNDGTYTFDVSGWPDGIKTIIGFGKLFGSVWEVFVTCRSEQPNNANATYRNFSVTDDQISKRRVTLEFEYSMKKHTGNTNYIELSNSYNGLVNVYHSNIDYTYGGMQSEMFVKESMTIDVLSGPVTFGFISRLYPNTGCPRIRCVHFITEVYREGAYIEAELKMGYFLDIELEAGNASLDNTLLVHKLSLDGELISEEAIITSIPSRNDLISDNAHLHADAEVEHVHWLSGIRAVPYAISGCGFYKGLTVTTEKVLLGLDLDVTHVDVIVDIYDNPDRFMILEGDQTTIPISDLTQKRGRYREDMVLFDSGWISDCTTRQCLEDLVVRIQNDQQTGSISIKDFFEQYDPGVSQGTYTFDVSQWPFGIKTLVMFPSQFGSAYGLEISCRRTDLNSGVGEATMTGTNFVLKWINGELVAGDATMTGQLYLKHEIDGDMEAGWASFDNENLHNWLISERANMYAEIARTIVGTGLPVPNPAKMDGYGIHTIVLDIDLYAEEAELANPPSTITNVEPTNLQAGEATLTGDLADTYIAKGDLISGTGQTGTTCIDEFTQHNPMVPWEIYYDNNNILCITTNRNIPQEYTSVMTFEIPGNVVLHFIWDVMTPYDDPDYFDVYANDELLMSENSNTTERGFKPFSYVNNSNEPKTIKFSYTRGSQTRVNRAIIKHICYTYLTPASTTGLLVVNDGV